MLRVVIGAGLAFLTCGAAIAQTSPTFEVASIKPAAPPEKAGMFRVMMRGGPGTADPGQITYAGVTLKNILTNAYGVRPYQISGPAWLDTERFDITAKIAPGTTKEEFKLMLQNLVAERFKLSLHHEAKEMPMYSLVVAKGGIKMKESVEEAPTGDGPSANGGAPSGPPPGGPVRFSMGADGVPKMPAGMPKGNMMMMMNGRSRISANKQTMTGLVDMLSNQVGKPITDNTGLTGKYDFTLDFAPDDTMRGGMGGGVVMHAQVEGGGGGGGGGGVPSAPDAEAGPSLFTAVQEQLGLKLEQKKGPVDLLVIDRAEKTPTDN